jgi:hypothetical protein
MDRNKEEGARSMKLFIRELNFVYKSFETEKIQQIASPDFVPHRDRNDGHVERSW